MDIATHIAYLIGDSGREVIPDYNPQAGWATLLDDNHTEFNPSESNRIVFFSNDWHQDLEEPVVPISEHPHPDGVYKIIGEGVAALFHPGIGWVGSLTAMQQGYEYYIGYQDPTGQQNNLQTNAYGIQTDWESYELAIERDMLNKWLRESIIKVSKLMPTKYKLHMVGSKLFTSEELSNPSNYPSVFDYSSDIISVSRYDGDMLYECRMIPYNLRHKAKLNSGFLDECSMEDPVYTIAPDGLIRVYPTAQETNTDSQDGLCNVDYIHYPYIDVVNDDFVGVPADVQETVLVATAIKAKSYQISSLQLPESPVLNPEFKVVMLDKPGDNWDDAIEKAQKIVDNYGDYGFNKLLEAEDIDLAMLALKGSAQELEIAKTQLTEQDKVASEYLSEYSQNISKFGQELGAYSAKYKKLSAELDTLQAEYQEHIYAFRGELPNKKQLKDTEKRLESIKQVVNRT